jgi:hypothetical protein
MSHPVAPYVGQGVVKRFIQALFTGLDRIGGVARPAIKANCCSGFLQFKAISTPAAKNG